MKPPDQLPTDVAKAAAVKRLRQAGIAKTNKYMNAANAKTSLDLPGAERGGPAVKFQPGARPGKLGTAPQVKGY